MTESRKVQLATELDASGAKQGFAEIKQGARDMAQAVGEAGTQAGKGLGAVGEGGDAAAQKLDRSTKSIIQSIERATAATVAGERGTAKYFEALAQQRGVDPALIKGYIDQLKAAEAAQQAASNSLGKMGASAAQTTAALRNVPAQFTDIIVSLQSGQQPLTVLLQQGGQLKDMFGGTGEAAKALGGYIAGMVNPYTLLAAAVGTLAYGYYAGSQEAAGFSRTLTLSGNQAGVTAAQMASMAEAIGAVSGSRSRAAEVLNAIASAGQVGAVNLQRFVAAAVELERVGGPAAEETAKAFAELGRAPLEASLKLDAATGHLTESTYAQIKALEEQGRTVDAARVAQEAYAAALEQRAPAMLETLGLVEKAWLGIKGAASGAAEAVLRVGRSSTLQDQMRGLEAQLADLDGSSPLANRGGSLAARRLEAERLRPLLVDQLRMLQQGAAYEAQSAAYAADAAAQRKALVEWDKAGLQYLSKSEQLERAINKAVIEGVAAGKDSLAVVARIKAIREAMAEKSGGGASRDAFAAERDAAKEWARYYEKFAEAVAQADGKVSHLTKTQIELGQFLASPAYQQMPEPARQLALQQAYAAISAEQLAEKMKAGAKATEEAAKAQQAYQAELDKGGNQAAERVRQLRDEEDGLARAAALNISLAQALELVAISRLQEQQSAMMGAGNQAGVDAIQREIDKRRELAALIGNKDAREATKKALTDTEREVERMARSTEQMIADSLMRGFEAGKGPAEAFKSTVEAMFKTMVLRPTIEAAAKQASGGSDGAKAISQWLPYLDAAVSASAGKWGEAAGTAFGYYVGGPLGAVIGKTLGSSVDKFFSGGAGTPHQGAMYLSNGAYGYVPGAGVVGDMAWGDSVYKNRSGQVEDYLKGVTTGTAAALNSISKNFGGLGGFQVGGYFAADNKDASQGNIKILQGGTAVSTISAKYSANGEQGLKEYTAQLSAEVKKAITDIGLPAWAKGMLDKIGEAPALDQLAATVDSINATQKALGDLDAAFTPLGGVFSRIAALGSDSTLKLAEFAGGLTGLDSLTRSYYDQFTTEAEKTAATTQRLTDSLGALGFALPATREGFKALVDAATTPAKLASEEGLKTAAELLKLSPAFASITPEVKALGDASTGTAREIAAAAERMAEAGRQALAGLADDRGGLEVELLRAQGQGAAAAALELQRTLARLTQGLNATDAAAVTAAQAYNDGLRAQIETQRAAAEQSQALSSQRYDIEGQLLQAQGDTAALRQRELAALDPSNRALQERIYALQDEQASAQALAQTQAAASQAAEAIASQRTGLEGQLLQAQGDTAALRKRELAALDPSNRALQERIYALQDEQASAQALAQTQAAAAQAAEAIASQRTGLEGQLLQAQGDIAALRQRELAALDPSNRALQERIYAIQDEQAAKVLADQAIAKAAEQAAAQVQALASIMGNLGATRFDLQNQLLTAQGQGGEVLRRTRERDLAELTKGLSVDDAAKVTAAYDLNAALRQQIAETQAAQQAAQALAQAQAQAAADAQRAAEQIKSAWQSVTDSIFDEVARIRGLAGADSAGSLAAAQAQFAIANAQARAGDQEVARLLPGLSQTLLTLAEAQATSFAELQRIRAMAAGSLETTGSSLAARFGLNLPRFDVGTNYVPQDMVAVVHQGEAIVPRAYNPAAQGGGTGAGSTAALVAEVRALREQNADQARALAQLQLRMTKVLELWESGGMPTTRNEDAVTP